MQTKINRMIRTAISLLALLGLLAPGVQPIQAAPGAQASASPLAPLAPSATLWCLAGDFQGWNNASTPLFDDGTNGDLVPNDGVFSLDYPVATAGKHEWKAVECGNWGLAYPGQNAWFFTAAADQTVKFTFDTNNHAADAGLDYLPAQFIVNTYFDALPASFTAVGDFQGWNNANPATLMAPVGNGFYYLKYAIATPGTYQAKVAHTGFWDEQYGADGRSVNAATLSFTTSVANEEVIFLLDTNTARLYIGANGSPVAGNWCAAGSFQGWNNSSTPLYDDGTNGDLVGGDGVFSRDVTIATAGRYEWKAVECGNWSVAYPAQNAWLNTGITDQVVKITFDTNNHAADAGLDWLPAQYIVNAWDTLPASFTAVGDFQGWNNANPATLMADLDHGLHYLGYPVASSGSYIGKVTTTGAWDAFGADGRSIDAANVPFQVFTANDVVRFLLDTTSGRLAIYAPPAGGAAHDNNIFWNDLGHNSRDALFRTPGGPVPTNTSVKLRLRAASGDLTEAKVRLWNDRLNQQSFLPMSIVADDGTYEWWEASVPASAVPTVYWYRFIAIDGTATAYYEDDAARTGGWGQTFGSSPDYSWQLTVYDPAFQTPDWVKDAIIYQIFPDRFRDGDPANNTPAGTFFYDEPGGTIVRSNTSDWNTYICDPRDVNDCPGTYSKNFYGGDLAGLIDQLDYLQSLGVNTIYLNPIFESPSNHKYDTTDYSLIDDNFGDLTLFQTLATEADTRGMHIILDGVFNHTSSDSKYFDRYGRYPEVGACESQDSPYRGWYYFTDVTPGTGPCVGSDGTPNAARYESWFGFDSLPKLQANNAEVRDLIWNGGPNSIARYWMQWADGWRLDVGGDVDPGTLNDPTNDYWEGFRLAIHMTNPDAYIVGEEWGNASSWTLGGEWDATMNYQYSSAMLGFWRDTLFTDNDHNSGSSAGPLTPLTPSALDERLHNWKERYAPEAYYAMMNLLGSHDTNRPLFMLDHNVATGTDSAPLFNPAYDWSDAITRLKGVAILQMTLPGAPTIYYGDEVGLVGPVAYDGSTWQDDPYNRQPFPWLDETGAPFYTHLQTAGGQNDLRNHYKLLTTARNTHPALRTGSFDTLLVDDANNVYAYGRKLADNSDAAVVIVNRKTVSQTVSVDLSGYLPYGAELRNVLDGNAPYTISPAGLITLDVPGMSGAVLVLNAPAEDAPDAPTNLAVTAERATELDLSWTASAGATSYDLYRSLLSGGGYQWITNTVGTTYTDSGLTTGVDYYYVVVAVDDATGLVSGYSNEAAGLPHYLIGWANTQWPPTINHTIGITPTENIYGQVWIDGVTSSPGATPGLWAQVGYGPVGSQPITWTHWTTAVFNAQVGNNDEFKGQLTPEEVGTFNYLYRYSTTGGRDWVYADFNGPFTGTPPNPGVLTVNASTDTTAPQTPLNLAVTDWDTTFIELQWSPVTGDPTLYAYDMYRSEISGTIGVKVGRILAPTTVFTDTTVVGGVPYYYHVQALDTSFNRSGYSNQAEGIAEAKLVDVTFRLRVPDYSPGTVYIAGNLPGMPQWNPSATPMTKVSDNPDIWEITMSLPDGTVGEYKFTRGSWETVEQWGTITGLANRHLTVDYGTTGLQLVDLTATDWGTGSDETKAVQLWRDPLVVAYSPADGADNQPYTSTIQVTWSEPMPANTDFVVESPTGVISGTFAYDAVSYTVTFTPTEWLPGYTTFTITVAGKTDSGGDVQQVPTVWSFKTEFYTILPLMFKGSTLP
jgi:glycosidase/fibronectin type 3 domain-containing protein